MTSNLMYPSWNGMDKFSVGFEEMFNKLHRLTDDINRTGSVSNYPPYNIKNTSENHYLIEIAVAGFDESNIDITFEDGKLIVQGTSPNEENEEEILWKGISTRNFNRAFTLADTVEVEGAELVNGMLKIWLVNVIPEDKKSRKIELKKRVSKPKQFLSEEG